MAARSKSPLERPESRRCLFDSGLGQTAASSSCLEPDSSLPVSGEALLEFKARNEAPVEVRWGAGGVHLDDPAERLAELGDFEELSAENSPDEEAAWSAATKASAALRAATTADVKLQPWHSALKAVLEESVAEPELPVAVAPGLLLGDGDAAEDVPRLRTLGVTHVLNASNIRFVDADEYAAAGMSYLQLNARDEIGYAMRSHLEEARAFIQQACDRGGVCLCHCAAGINRSGFVVASEVTCTRCACKARMLPA